MDAGPMRILLWAVLFSVPASHLFGQQESVLRAGWGRRRGQRPALLLPSYIGARFRSDTNSRNRRDRVALSVLC